MKWPMQLWLVSKISETAAGRPAQMAKRHSPGWHAAVLLSKQCIAAFRARESGRRLRLVERLPLGDKQFVALIEVDGHDFLALMGPGGSLALTPLKKSPCTSFAKKTSRSKAADGSGEAKNQPEAISLQLPEPAAKIKPILLESKLEAAEQEKRKASAIRKRTQEQARSSQEHIENAAAVRSQMPEPGHSRRQQQAAEVSSALVQAKRTKQPPCDEAAQARSKQPATVVSRSAFLPNSVQSEAGAHPSSWMVLEAESVLRQAQSVQAEHEAKSIRERPDQAAAPQAAVPSEIFAAVMEARMLAQEVFEGIGSSTGAPATGMSDPQASLPQPLSAAMGAEEQAAESATSQPQPPLPTAESVGVSRQGIRRRLGVAGILAGVLLLIPHARGQMVPIRDGLPTSAIAAALPPSAPMEMLSAFASLSIERLSPALAVGLAAVQAPGNEIRISGLGGSSASWSIVVLLTLLSLIPSLLFCVTPFARLLIIFHFLRQALGLQTTPSNQTLIGLSLILTFFLMQPTGEAIYKTAVLPVQAGKMTPLDGVVRAGEPLRHFMAHYVREKDAELFLEIAKEPRPRTVEDLSFRVLLPAYVLSELKAGFQIGTVLFLPFLIVDMVVASITTSVGMMQLPPVVISTPLKLLLFLMVDGWHLLIEATMRSFR